MRDYCKELRLTLCEMLQSVKIAATPSGLCLCCADCEAAFALRFGQRPPQTKDIKHLWIAAAETRGNRICFILHEAFYREAAAHILCDELPPLPATIDGPVSYARARMCMLARKGGDSFDESLRNALWRALYANESGISRQERGKRMRTAAKSALMIGENIPLGGRQAYFSGCGMAAACLARLLYDDTEKEMI